MRGVGAQKNDDATEEGNVPLKERDGGEESWWGERTGGSMRTKQMNNREHEEGECGSCNKKREEATEENRRLEKILCPEGIKEERIGRENPEGVVDQSEVEREGTDFCVHVRRCGENEMRDEKETKTE